VLHDRGGLGCQARDAELQLSRRTVIADRRDEQVQDAEALGDEEQVSDRIEERDGALDLGCRYGLVLEHGKLVA
jgi:hypothetical protein